MKLEKHRLIAKSKRLDKFIENIKDRPQVIGEWDVLLWYAEIDSVVVTPNGTLTFDTKMGAKWMFKVYQ